ncbi:MAG: hypothetical protein RLZZ546_832 [Bacteroidota bacterium]|jgi:thiol-disulfide isomerase/thioredoxin
MRGFLILSFVFLSVGLIAQGIQFFEGTWSEALEKANKEEKLLFVDAYAQWCGPCKAMAKNVFTKDEVGRFFNENFINLKLDMETKDGKTFDSKYPVSAYPTLLFLDGKGKIVKKVVGGQQVESLIAHGKEALKKNDTSVDLALEYEKGNREYDFMLKYVKSLNNAGKPSLKISNDYLNSNPSISEDQKSIFIFESIAEADSKLFEQVISQKEKYIKAVGKERYDEKIKMACRATMEKSIEYEMPELMDEASEKAIKGLSNGGEEYKYTLQMGYYSSLKNKDSYLKAADNLAKVSRSNEKTLRYVAEDICKTYKDDTKVLSKATQYAQDIYKLNKNFENLSFCCKMLIENKEIDKALKYAEEALSEAKKKEEDTLQIDGLINLLKAKKG